MRADVVAKINSGLQTIKSYLDSTHTGVKITSHEVIGAAVTYQYTEKSDIDTTVFINIGENDPRFKVINDWIGDNVDGKMYHEKRPFQFKIKPAAYIGQQDANTGFMGGDGRPNMYQHGFAMLALAEAYGAVDDRTLWTGAGGEGRGRSIGQALELAVRAAVTSGRKNPLGGWHYGPDMPSADTSVARASPT
jgi:hypothetical protein